VHATAYGIDTNWHLDSGATNHITRALNKLTIHDKYNGCDRVHTVDGNGMHISHIGHSVLHTPSSPLHLKNILHVPSASKNLLSIHRLTLDNLVFLEFHPFFFLIKDLVTRRTLFKGPYHGGLYPLVPFSTGSSKQVSNTIKLSSSTWHHCLGHPSSFVVQQIIRKNKLSHLPKINPYVCDSCQLAKSHQLPYPVSTSVSTVPFEQVLSDIWGPAPVSVGKYAYYVSFIDEHSKFT
jgi:histone deacetylase 1/2